VLLDVGGLGGRHDTTGRAIDYAVPPAETTVRRVAGELIWMDLEMTGLDPEVNVILEMATIVTDSELQVIAEGPVIAVRQPEEKLAEMDEWNVSHHTASGLLKRVRDEGVAPVEAEATTLAFLEKHTEKGTAPLCGNTIWQDRRFLAKHMPTLESYLHYRIIDVSSIKELMQRWRPDLAAGVTKQNEHLALADIRESIAELAFYRDNFFLLSRR
jgi:oligoribonuclease